MKKILVLILSVILVLTIFTGCKKNEEPMDEQKETQQTKQATEQPTKEAQEEPEEAEPVAIKVRSWHAEYEEDYGVLFEMFNEANPNITVEYDLKPNDQYYSVLNTEIQAGEAPDLFSSHGSKTINLSQMVEAGACLELDGLLELDGYDDLVISVTKINDKMYMSPGQFFVPEFVYYNVGLFEEYGLEVPKTIAELLDVCQTLLDNGVQPFAMPGQAEWTQFWFMNCLVTSLAPDWVDEFAAGTVKTNDPRFIDAYKRQQEFIDKGYFGENFLNTDGNAATLAFTSGEAAMIVEGSWSMQGLTVNEETKVSAFVFPGDDAGKKIMLASPETSTGYSVYSGSENQDEAIALINFLMQKESVQILADSSCSGSIPAVSGVSAGSEMGKKVAEGTTFADQFYNYFSPRAKEDYNPGMDVISFSQQVLFGQMTVEEFVASMDEEIN